MALGGHHDVFNDPCPEFKPRDFAMEDSIVTTDDESQVAEPAVCAASGFSSKYLLHTCLYACLRSVSVLGSHFRVTDER